MHIDVAAYYDTPVISLRDVLLPRILNDPTANPAPGGVLGPAAKVGLEVKKWFRNVPEEEKIEGDAKVVDGVDLMHVSGAGEPLQQNSPRLVRLPTSAPHCIHSDKSSRT